MGSTCQNVGFCISKCTCTSVRKACICANRHANIGIIINGPWWFATISSQNQQKKWVITRNYPIRNDPGRWCHINITKQKVCWWHLWSAAPHGQSLQILHQHLLVFTRAGIIGTWPAELSWQTDVPSHELKISRWIRDKTPCLSATLRALSCTTPLQRLKLLSCANHRCHYNKAARIPRWQLIHLRSKITDQWNIYESCHLHGLNENVALPNFSID